MSPTPSLPEVLARLDRFTNHEVASSSGITAGAIDGLSLDVMRHLCALSGDPHLAVPVIHVTGTNGKGSVAAMISRLLVATGLTVGTYASPHLVSVHERIRRDGESIGDDDLAEVLDATIEIASLMDTPPSWFELVTCAAFRWFAESGVHVAVIEVGLLGRFDATNVVESTVSVITNVGGDHTDFALGWRSKVASEKAGIIMAGGDVVLGQLDAELDAAVAAEHPGRVIAVGRDIDVTRNELALGGRDIDFVTPWARHDEVTLLVHGAHQANNFAVATATVEAFFDRALDDDVVADAAAQVILEGRSEVLGHQPLIVVDGAHNAEAALSLATTIDEEFSVIGSRLAVIGMLQGRDPRPFVEALATARLDAVIATRPETPRGADPAGLVAACHEAGIAVQRIDDPRVAVATVLSRASEEDLVLVCGSYYLVGPARQQILLGT